MSERRATHPRLPGAGGSGSMLSIGTLARRTGTKVQTIRYYEQIGLMRAAERSEGGQRRYAPADLDRLAFIRHARELGFAVDAIRELLDLSDRPAASCEAADILARRHLEGVETRLRRLEALKGELERMLDECAGGRVAECRVIEALRDHRGSPSNEPEAEPPA